jgi:hypothetical protein
MVPLLNICDRLPGYMHAHAGIPARILAFHSFDSVMIERALGRTAAHAANDRHRRAEEELLASTGFTADQVLRPFAYTGDGRLKDKPVDGKGLQRQAVLWFQ